MLVKRKHAKMGQWQMEEAPVWFGLKQMAGALVFGSRGLLALLLPPPRETVLPQVDTTMNHRPHMVQSLWASSHAIAAKESARTNPTKIRRATPAGTAPRIQGLTSVWRASLFSGADIVCVLVFIRCVVQL